MNIAFLDDDLHKCLLFWIIFNTVNFVLIEPLQSQNDSQQSNSNSQTTVNNSKRKRKLAKPKKIRKREDADNVQDISREVRGHRFFHFFL